MDENELMIEPVSWDKEDDIPKDATIIDLRKGANKMEKNITENKQEQQQSRKVKEVLAEDVIMIHGISYTHAEAKKFMPLFEKIEQDLTACVIAIEKEEQKHKEAKENAETDPE